MIRRSIIASAVGLVLCVGALGGLAEAGSVAPSVSPAATAGAVFLNVTATTSLSFQPSTLNVAPGQSVHLIVTQQANFYHTFTLSPLPNFTFASTATGANLTSFFAAHTPLVDLNLSQTVGSRHYANFTAPGVGSYEFLCTAYGGTHFQSGMFGTLVSSSASTSSPSSSPSWLIPVIVVVVVVVIVVAAAAAMMMRRKPKAPDPTAPTPASDGTKPPAG